jgi:LysR substrate binding domain
LRLLSEAVENARSRPRRTSPNLMLTVSVLPSLAARWLVPRLRRFQASHPDIDIAIHPTSTLAALDGRDGIDLAIRYGAGKWYGLNASPLMKSFIFPVCSPGFLAQTPISSLDDLLKAALLRNPRQKWRPWFLAAGLDVPEPAQGPIYDDAGLLLQAAAAGQGIALARSALQSTISRRVVLCACPILRSRMITVGSSYGGSLCTAAASISMRLRRGSGKRRRTTRAHLPMAFISARRRSLVCQHAARTNKTNCDSRLAVRSPAQTIRSVSLSTTLPTKAEPISEHTTPRLTTVGIDLQQHGHGPLPGPGELRRSFIKLQGYPAAYPVWRIPWHPTSLARRNRSGNRSHSSNPFRRRRTRAGVASLRSGSPITAARTATSRP